MSKTKNFINLISTGKYASAKLALSELLNRKAIEHIDTMKPDVTKNLFGRSE